jgi:hypothetical protein
MFLVFIERNNLKARYVLNKTNYVNHNFENKLKFVYGAPDQFDSTYRRFLILITAVCVLFDREKIDCSVAFAVHLTNI